MSFNTKQLLLCAALSCTARADFGAIFDDMHRSMEKMREEMNALFDAAGSLGSGIEHKDATTISLQETKEGVTIRVPLEGAENFDSSLHDHDRLIISVPSHGMKINVSTEGNWLTVKSLQSNQEKQAHKKDTKEHISSFSSSSSHRLLLSDALSLDNVELSYQDNALTISIPKKTGKKIEVKVKK